MKGFFFRLVITALGLWAAETIIPGIHIDGWGNLIVASLLLGIVNAVIRPFILIFRAPKERVERPCRAPVVERIRRAVENAHDDDAPPHVDGAVTELERRVRRGGHVGRLPRRSPRYRTYTRAVRARRAATARPRRHARRE